MLAAKVVGNDYMAWEPESIWLSMERMGIDVPVINRIKLMAGVTLVVMPSFYWDGVVFENTALAFDHLIPTPDALDEATAAQCAWAVREATWILSQHGDPSRDFFHEPAAYVAVVLHREGFVLAPSQLAFAQDQLDLLNPTCKSDKNCHKLRDETKTAWAALDKKNLEHHPFSESPVDVQLARLAAVELHIRDREAQTAADLAQLA